MTAGTPPPYQPTFAPQRANHGGGTLVDILKKLLLGVAIFLLVACGGATVTPTADPTPTQTRATEMPGATTVATPNGVVATQQAAQPTTSAKTPTRIPQTIPASTASRSSSVVAGQTRQGGTPSAMPRSPVVLSTPASTGSVGWNSLSPMAIARKGHTATLLAGGQVLVVGGDNTDGALASAERYDTVANRWNSGGNMGIDRTLYLCSFA